LKTLHVDLRPGESVVIGGDVTVTLEQKSGRLARLAIKHDPSKTKVDAPIRVKTGAAQAARGIVS
jgi:sRNA-binding carbon storage regulator CsrA